MLEDEGLSSQESSGDDIKSKIHDNRPFQLVEGKKYSIAGTGTTFYRTHKRFESTASEVRTIYELQKDMRWGVIKPEKLHLVPLHQEKGLNVVQSAEKLEIPANLSEMVNTVFYTAGNLANPGPRKAIPIVRNPVLANFEKQVEEALSIAVVSYEGLKGKCAKARVQLDRRLGQRPIVRLPGKRQIKVHLVVKPITVMAPSEMWSDKVVKEFEQALAQQKLSHCRFEVDYEKSIKAMQVRTLPLECGRFYSSVDASYLRCCSSTLCIIRAPASACPCFRARPLRMPPVHVPPFCMLVFTP
jgi:hypothetical protein